MKTKAIFASAVVLALLLFTAILLIPRHTSQGVTVRHIGSAQSGNVTTMTFEIKNQTADPYIFYPFEVQIRSGDAWTRFQGFDMTQIHPHARLAAGAVTSYTVNVTNLLAESVVRFSIRPQKILLGLNGLVRRAELNLETKTGGGGGGLPLNPYDRNSEVYGLPTKVMTEEWVETAK